MFMMMSPFNSSICSDFALIMTQENTKTHINPDPKHSYTIIKDSTFNCVDADALRLCVQT